MREASSTANTPRFGYFEPDFYPVCRCGCSWAIKRKPTDPWRCDRGHFLSFPKEPRGL